MNLTKIFKESICYPFQDRRKWIILGVLILIPDILFILTQIVQVEILVVITNILILCFCFIVEGYGISVIKNTIQGFNQIPDFDWNENFINGFRLFVMEFVYIISIIIIFTIVLEITSSFKLLPSLIKFNLTNSIIPFTIDSVPYFAIPSINKVLNSIHSLNSLFFIGLIVVLFFAIVAMFFMMISICRLAKTDSIRLALSWSGIIEDIKSIGVGKFVVWYIILMIIFIILLFITDFILIISSIIPIIGSFIATVIIAFFVPPFFILFTSKALGLLYVKV